MGTNICPGCGKPESKCTAGLGPEPWERVPEPDPEPPEENPGAVGIPEYDTEYNPLG